MDRWEVCNQKEDKPLTSKKRLQSMFPDHRASQVSGKGPLLGKEN